MNTKEPLIWAAAAAQAAGDRTGFRFQFVNEIQGIRWDSRENEGPLEIRLGKEPVAYWNPLLNDDEAMRLGVVTNTIRGPQYEETYNALESMGALPACPHAANRMVITVAAAWVGKTTSGYQAAENLKDAAPVGNMSMDSVVNRSYPQPKIAVDPLMGAQEMGSCTPYTSRKPFYLSRSRYANH